MLLGVDQISMEVEQPLDVLPLHAFARGMSTDVLAVIESWATMPARRQAEGAVLLGAAQRTEAALRLGSLGSR